MSPVSEVFYTVVAVLKHTQASKAKQGWATGWVRLLACSCFALLCFAHGLNDPLLTVFMR